MLYPANVWLWSRVAAFLNLSAADPIGFLHNVAAMNAVCAGGSVALVYLLVWRFTQAWKVASVCAVIFALSRALLMHATNSAEPVVGLFVSLVAVWLTTEGLVSQRPAALFLGGACLALALANYESMFLAAPALYLLCLLWPTSRGSESRLGDNLHSLSSLSIQWLPLFRLFTCGLGTLVGVIVIYGTAYYSVGISQPRKMLQDFMQMGGGRQVYGGFRMAKLANLPVGLVGNLVAVTPANYQGLRSLVAASHHLLLPLIALIGVVAVVALILIILGSSFARFYQTRNTAVVASAVLGAFLIELFASLYWDPLYDKLWLQPLALGLVLAGVLAHWTNTSSNRRFNVLVLALLVTEAAFNLPQAISAHVKPTSCLEDAQKVASSVRPSDMVVSDFDPVSALWMSLYDRDPTRTMVFPATPAAVSIPTIGRWRKKCSRSNCRILFVTLLDQTKQNWNGFLGNRLGVPYEALNPYRRESRSLDRFTCEDSSLRAYSPDD
jgi:hypothetical protein